MNPFLNSQYYRDIILKNIQIRSIEAFDGRSLVYMYLTDFCPVGCSHCYSDSKNNFKNNPLSKQEINKRLEFINDSQTEYLFISGGGEPFESFSQLLEFVEKANAKNIILVSSGNWAENKKKTIDYLYDISKRRMQNLNNQNVFLRLSVDKYHAEKIYFENFLNIVRSFQKIFCDQNDIKLMVHTLFEDNTVDEYLKRAFLVKSKERIKENLVRVILNDGFGFDVEYSSLMEKKKKFKMDKKMQILASFYASHKQQIVQYGRITPGVYIDSDGKKGLDFLIKRDGSVELWGSTSPDNLININNCSFSKVKKIVLSDIVSLSLLNKGLIYMNSVLNEVDAQSSLFAQYTNNIDDYCKITLKKDKNQLYYSVRAIIDYLRENKIQIQDIPDEIRNLVLLDKKELFKLYNEN